MTSRSSRDTAFILLMVVLAAYVRLDFLIASHWIIDSDEGIVGLMAKHISDGRPVPIFYYGQPYMGSFEAVLAAFLFKFFGASAVALKMVPLLFSIALVPLMYKLAAALGGKIAGRSAALLWALPPSPLVVWSAMARGGFIEIVWLGALALYLTVQWLRSDKVSFFTPFVIALVLGFGWWVNNQIVYFAIPILFFIFCRILGERKERPALLLRAAVAFVTGFAIGSLPFWIYNFNNSFASFGIFGRAKEGDALSHLQGLFSTALPMLLGAKRFWHDEDVFAGATAAVLTLFGVFLLVILATRIGAIAKLALLSVDRRKPVELFLLFILTALVAFAFSSFGHLVTAPRYLLPIYVGVYVLVGYLAAFLSPLNPALARGLVGLVLLLNFCSCYLGGRALPGQPFVALNQRASNDHAELIAWLSEHHSSFVRTNYWIGYRLAFETKEQIKFVLFQEPHQIRIPEYESEGSGVALHDMPFVLVPAQAPFVANALTTLGYLFDTAQLSGYVVLYNVAPPPGAKPVLQYEASGDGLHSVPDGAFTVQANVHPGNSAEAADGSAATRWGSGEPQHPGMQVELALKEPRTIGGLFYNIDAWATDFPRGLTIEVETPGGEKRTALSEQQYQALRYLTEGTPHWRIAFGPIEASRVTLTETESDPVFDWSIGEVGLLE